MAGSLSVVIPYYRGAATIREALESVLAQTRQPDEIVICDDGSPDDLEAALGELRAEVTIVRKANGGISSAMNAATAAARGDLLVQLDQDDAFMPRRLEAIAAAAAADPDADIIATDAVIEHDGAAIAVLSDLHPFDAENQRIAILGGCFFLWPAIRRTRLLAVGGYDESFPVMQDWECFIRLIMDGARAVYVDEPLYRWRLTTGSRSSSNGVENAETLVRMIEKTLDHASLNDTERTAAEVALASHLRRLAVERAQHAVETRARDARRRSLALAIGRGFPIPTRVKGAAAALSPRLALRLMSTRRERDPGADALAQRGFQRPH